MWISGAILVLCGTFGFQGNFIWGNMMMMVMMMMMMGSIWGASHSWLLSSPQGLTHSIISSTALFAKKPMNSTIIMMIMVNTTSHLVLYTNQYLFKSLLSHFLSFFIGILWKVKHHGWMTVFSISITVVSAHAAFFFLVISWYMIWMISQKSQSLHMPQYGKFVKLVIQKIESIWVWMIGGSKKSAL